MKTAVNESMTYSSPLAPVAGRVKWHWRRLSVGVLLCVGLTGPVLAAPATAPTASADHSAAAPANPAAAPVEPTAPANAPTVPQRSPPSQQQFMQMDLSVWGMYQHADVVVKTVMIGLLIASIVTWALFFGKSAELIGAKRRLKHELLALKQVRNLDQAAAVAKQFSANSVSQAMLAETSNELELSANSNDNNGIKERAAFRLERQVAATGRAMGKGNGFLATIGAISPFIGLFGTVWGIMNSFIGIAHTQTTNLAVVAPGIAEALLATAVGLFAAIPAVVIYNVFARTIASYKAQVGDSAALMLLLLSRDLDLADSPVQHSQNVPKFRVG